MTYLTRSAAHPGHWQLGEYELAPGDVIEVLLLDTWYRARVQYEATRPEHPEYQLLIDNHSYSMPLLEGRPARWPANDNTAEGKVLEKPGS